MKKKLKFIGLLVLLWVLIANSTANATIVNITEENISDYNYTVGSGTVGIVDTKSAVGTVSDLSLKLVWPATTDDAGIRITDLDSPTISSISGYSYWVNAPLSKNPRLTMFLDVDNSGTWDTAVNVRTGNTGYADKWLEIDSSGTIIFKIFPPAPASAYAKSWTWSDFQTNFGDAVVKQIELSHYGITTSITTTAYLDDFSFGNTDYVIGIPEPATIALLGLGSIVLLRRRMRK